MVIKNKIDKPFGPAGSFAGMVIFAGGLVAAFFSLSALILVVAGAFLGFTYTSALIDTDNKQVKYATNLFGLIPIGKWMALRTDMKLGIRQSKLAYRTYSRSNRILDEIVRDYRIMLYGADGAEIMPLQKFDTPEAAREGLGKLAGEMGIGVK